MTQLVRIILILSMTLLERSISLHVNTPSSLSGFFRSALIVYDQPERADFSPFHTLLFRGELFEGVSLPLLFSSLLFSSLLFLLCLVSPLLPLPSSTISLPYASASLRQRNEKDQVQILSGTEMGITLGTPIGLFVPNEDQRPGDYKSMNQYPRPSHADYTYLEKYGLKASSGGGRASARETIGFFSLFSCSCSM